jgi:hypothetical protein
MTVAELYDKLIEKELFTEGELHLITSVNGFNFETLNDCIYARYGYRNYEQLLEDEDD